MGNKIAVLALGCHLKNRVCVEVRGLASGMLYHLVPQRVVGSRLLPLNQLRESHPELYEAYARKYQGREHLLTQPVPDLECLWSDVLFLTAVPPDAIRELHEEVGIEVPPLRWFEVDWRVLEASKLYVSWYLHSDPDSKGDPANWEPFQESLLPRLREVPAATRDHYSGAARSGRRPFAFFRIPHVLYKGGLELEEVRVIDG